MDGFLCSFKTFTYKTFKTDQQLQTVLMFWTVLETQSDECTKKDLFKFFLNDLNVGLVKPATAVFPSRVTHAVAECGVTSGLSQQQFDDLHVTVFAGAHQRRGSFVVLDIDVGPESQQGPNHIHPAVTDRQHQPRLTSLTQHRQTTATFTFSSCPNVRIRLANKYFIHTNTILKLVVLRCVLSFE